MKKLGTKICFTIILTFLIFLLVACNKEAKQTGMDIKRLEEISLQVDALFNESKDDLAEGLDDEGLQAVLEVLDREKQDELSDENSEFYKRLVNLHELARNMYKFQMLVARLVDVDGRVSEVDYLTVKKQLNIFENSETFYNRLTEQLNEIGEALEKQLTLEKQIADLEELFGGYYDKDGKLIKSVTDKDYKKVKKLVNEIEDVAVNEDFVKQLDELQQDIKAVAKAKKEEEERLAREKKEKEEVEQTQVVTSTQSNVELNTSQSNSNNNQAGSNTTTAKNTSNSSSNSSNNGSSSNSDTGNKVESESKPETTPELETKPKEEKIIYGKIGNSGKTWCCDDAGATKAEEWAYSIFNDPEKWKVWEEKGYSGFWVEPIVYGYTGWDDSTKTEYTVDFYK